MLCKLKVALDRFGRVVDQRWIPITGSSSSSAAAAIARVDYGYDQDSNRQWRNDQVAGTGQDEYYTYDGQQRLTILQRGTLNGGKTGISGTPSWEEDFAFDPTGNWNGTSSSSSGGYVTKVSGTITLSQNRTHSEANEITAIPTATGTAWQAPACDANGNATTSPQPVSLASGYTCAYDAWNRLMTVKSGATTVDTYRYDGANRRVQKITSSTRDYYYSKQWQILEEQVSTPAPGCPERQFVWGLRYEDDLILRDRVTSQSSSSTCQATNERLYVLHDYFQPTAVINTAGAVQERYSYNAYGAVAFMTAAYGSRASSSYQWETLYGAYRWDSDTGLYQVRNRYMHPYLGRWINRDPIDYRGGVNLYSYCKNNPLASVDPEGLMRVVATTFYEDPTCFQITFKPAKNTSTCTWVCYCPQGFVHDAQEGPNSDQITIQGTCKPSDCDPAPQPAPCFMNIYVEVPDPEPVYVWGVIGYVVCGILEELPVLILVAL